MDGKLTSPPIGILKYKKGDLILKEGDYGIAIYKIVRGRVEIFNESGGKRTQLAVLGRGEVMGEMSFLNRGRAPRTASARALEDSELEVWHPDTLVDDYEQMPTIIKHITNQTLKRLVRMNRLIAQLNLKREREKEQAAKSRPDSLQRHFYRREVNLPCICRSLDALPKTPFDGRIRDISNSGVGLEISARKIEGQGFDLGNEIHISVVLPNGRSMDAIAKIVDNRSSQVPGKALLGMEFTEMSNESRRTLGFFLMS
jgi:CRP-like cAMP-binding protein